MDAHLTRVLGLRDAVNPLPNARGRRQITHNRNPLTSPTFAFDSDHEYRARKPCLFCYDTMQPPVCLARSSYLDSAGNSGERRALGNFAEHVLSQRGVQRLDSTRMTGLWILDEVNSNSDLLFPRVCVSSWAERLRYDMFCRTPRDIAAWALETRIQSVIRSAFATQQPSGTTALSSTFNVRALPQPHWSHAHEARR